MKEKTLLIMAAGMGSRTGNGCDGQHESRYA